MTKRTEVVKFLTRHGFVSVGGTKHEKFKNAEGTCVVVPRHREIREFTFEQIKKEARLR